WVKFCLTAHFRQAETLLRRTQETGRLAEILEEEVKRRGLNERTVAALLDAAYGYRVRNTSYRKAVDVSDAVSSRDLGALANAGLLVAHG
ncbi:filamentation induced by cAMP protein Fic, partial [mine drainage metagenome]